MTAVARIRPVVLLATGGMAEIWLARLEGAEGFHRPLVVKRAYPSPDARRALVDEATLLSRLAHPNLVHAYALVEDPDGLLLAMEHLSGTSLRALLDHLRRDDLALPPSIAGRIVADAARGLDHAHRATLPDGAPLGVVHGDISPENLVVTEIGITKVIDFGVAHSRLRKRPAPHARVEGRPAYLAPEQERGDAPSSRADVFALGAVLDELLAGAPIPAPIADVRRRMLAPEPALRTITMFDVADALERAVLQSGGTHHAVSSFLRSELGPTLDLRRAHLDALLGRPSADRSRSFGASRSSTAVLLERTLDAPDPPSDEPTSPGAPYEPHPPFGGGEDDS